MNKEEIRKSLEDKMMVRLPDYDWQLIYDKLDQAVAEERKMIVKDIKKINKSNEDITSYGDGFEDSISQVLTCITNRKVKIIIN